MVEVCKLWGISFTSIRGKFGSVFVGFGLHMVSRVSTMSGSGWAWVLVLPMPPCSIYLSLYITD